MLCKHASQRVEAAEPCQCCFAFVVKLWEGIKRKEKKTRYFIVDGADSAATTVCMLFFCTSICIIRIPVVAKCLCIYAFAFIWTYMHECVSVCVHVCMCQPCARITRERIRQPHFQFRSISARISVIPLKSRSSPTVTSHNGTNTRVVGTQLRLPGSIRRTFPIPQPVCMQTEPPQRRTLIWQPFTEPCVDIFNASITTA